MTTERRWIPLQTQLQETYKYRRLLSPANASWWSRVRARLPLRLLQQSQHSHMSEPHSTLHLQNTSVKLQVSALFLQTLLPKCHCVKTSVLKTKFAAIPKLPSLAFGSFRSNLTCIFVLQRVPDLILSLFTTHTLDADWKIEWLAYITDFFLVIKPSRE